MENQALDLWFAYPDDLLTEEASRACSSLLSEDERIRSEAFRFNRDRRQYLASRALLRHALSQYDPRKPEAWRFLSNSHGKSAIAPTCGLRFNLSHSSGLVACLIAHGLEVGVDVEPHERAGEIVEIAVSVFSPKELRQLESLSGTPKANRALSLWVLKEAYVKARGFGLSLPLTQFSFLFSDADNIRLETEPGLEENVGRWSFCLLNHAGHRVALVVEEVTDPRLQLFEIRMPSFTPEQPASAGVKWFPVRPKLP